MSELTEKKKYSEKSYKYMLVGMTFMLLVAVITAISFGFFIRRINTVEQFFSEAKYDKHFVFVGDETDIEFWEQVYDSSYAKAEEDGIYLENIRDSLKNNYKNTDLLRVAVNSDVDGIVYAGGYSEEVVKLIDKATENGIGVIVLHNDIEQSSRQCFVGVNNYELGQMFSSQIQDLTKDGRMRSKRIMILVNSGMSEGAANLVILGIEDELLKKYKEENLPEIELYRIEAEDTFSVEEEIRKIFLNSDNIPDIILCLEGIYTQCVYQAIVDYNHVGDVNVVGYFYDKDILEGIEKKIIYSTISVDTDEMGKACIEALEEYNEMGYTNAFLPVNMEIIEKSKAEMLLREDESEEVYK